MKKYSIISLDKFITKDLDFILIDSLHEPNHVEKVFYHYYNFLKKKGICIIDDISWLPYSKNQKRDKEFSEHINRSTFKKILEIFNENQKNFEYFYAGKYWRYKKRLGYTLKAKEQIF